MKRARAAAPATWSRHGCLRLRARRAVCCQAFTAELTKQQLDQTVRSGDSESDWMEMQAKKPEEEQPCIAAYLKPATATNTFDVCVVGCGPAGLTLSAALAERGASVCLVGPEAKFTNNYGVWVDEFRALGLGHLLEQTWDETLCYFLTKEKRLKRAYGQVNRTAMREYLLSRCAEHDVAYAASTVTAIDTPKQRSSSAASSSGDAAVARTDDGSAIRARIVTLAGGAPAGKFLRFEGGAPPVAAQTAYGVTARVEGYSAAFDPDVMLFMDYRRTHSGMWDGTGQVLARNQQSGEVTHPNWNANFGSCGEAPSFLYAMPLADGQVFLEETCLVARPTLPFSVLKRRLYRRCAAMGIRITEVTDEEHSFIPVGGPLPQARQPITAFGAAANLVHPATGYSITRMLEESGPLADNMVAILGRNLSVEDSAAEVWQALWPLEKRRQASFHIFGMELLATLEVQTMHEFFDTFFKLPDRYWRGFLASKLSSTDLMVFAMLMFLKCSAGVRVRLIQHLATPAGSYMIGIYTQNLREGLRKRLQRGSDKQT